MSSTDIREANVVLSIPGVAADHLYREGSAKASFWEVVFGSSLSSRRQTIVSAREDGAKVFEIPTSAVHDALMKSAITYFASASRLPGSEPALHALDARSLRWRLLGIQPQGSGIACFTLRMESTSSMTDPRLGKLFSGWFEESREALTRETLIPWGFTPDPANAGDR